MAVKYVIVAGPRTGSTTLWRAFNVLREGSCALEPFNVWLGGEKMENRSVNEILSRFDGIKHVYTWDMPVYDIVLLAKRRERIVMLHRKNILQQVVSYIFGERTKVWHDRREILRGKFQPFDLVELRIRIASLKQKVDFLRSSLQSPMEVTYEHLYGPQEIAVRLERFWELAAHVGYERSEAMDKIVSVMLAQWCKTNNYETYRMIPNADEIEAIFGSDENGHLFDDISMAECV
jgi:LPS sulfotransferase NodH